MSNIEHTKTYKPGTLNLSTRAIETEAGPMPLSVALMCAFPSPLRVRQCGKRSCIRLGKLFGMSQGRIAKLLSRRRPRRARESHFPMAAAAFAHFFRTNQLCTFEQTGEYQPVTVNMSVDTRVTERLLCFRPFHNAVPAAAWPL